tara:strand:- start:1030 stop:1389 length:360 start_codon:yes stop_codon:yes gene_type:complete
MAASLSLTKFHDSVDYKLVQCTEIEDATVFVNVTGAPGTLHSASIDSSKSSSNLSLHILDGKDTSNSEFIIRGTGLAVRSVQIPTGFAFDMLNFRVSANSAENDTTDFSGTVNVTLVCS